MFKLKKAIIFLLVVSLCPIVLISCGQEDKITTYNIECSLDGNVLNGTEFLTFYNKTENSFTELKFNIFANAYREGAKYSPVLQQYYANSYYNGVSYGKFEVIEVLSGEKNLEYEICGVDCNILSVKLDREVFPNESYTLMINYKITLANVISRTGINNDTINLACFYPILCAVDNNGFYECVYYGIGDPFCSECANYNVKFTYDSKYIVASSGEIISSKTENDKTTTTYKIEKARNFCFVLSTEFDVLEDKCGNVTVKYYYYKDEKPKESLVTIQKAIEYFSELFDEYPYSTYSVVETKFVEGGMEFSGLAYISDNLDYNSYQEVIVHETAHQWWFSVVGNNEIEEGFLDEGLAEYSVVLFYEHFNEYMVTRESLVDIATKSYKSFCSVYDKLYKNTDTSMNRSLGEFSSEYEYVNIAYMKSTIMLDTLRENIGDKRFFVGLKKYRENNEYKLATADDLICAFNQTGINTEGFFNGFIDGKVIL